jgi:hypothetical protein
MSSSVSIHQAFVTLQQSLQNKWQYAGGNKWQYAGGNEWQHAGGLAE